MQLRLFLALLTFFEEEKLGTSCVTPPVIAPAPFHSGMQSLLDCNQSHTAALIETKARFATGKKTMWSYWDKGLSSLSPFQKLNLCLWRQTLGEEWQVVIVDQDPNSPLHYAHFLSPSALPRAFFHPAFERLHQSGHLHAVYRSDMLRLALLDEFGGLWADLTTIPLRHPETFCSLDASLCGFILKQQGLEAFQFRNHFENWFILARPHSPIIQAWREAFTDFWDRHLSADYIRKFDTSHGLDFSHFWRRQKPNGTLFDLASYLTMHVTLLEKLTHDPLFRHLYLREAETFDGWEHGYTYVHASGGADWGSEATKRIFLDHLDRNLLARLRNNGWVLKFPSEEARPLQQASLERLRTSVSTLSALYLSRSLQLSKPKL